MNVTKFQYFEIVNLHQEEREITLMRQTKRILTDCSVLSTSGQQIYTKVCKMYA